MPRYTLTIEYNGAPFVGWQRQKEHLSVQQVIEEAVQKIEPECGSIFGAGRTDAGVHAIGQVAHVDLHKDWSPFRLSEAINFHLKPHPIAITSCSQVDDDFHARFSAIEREYLFRIIARRAPIVFERGLVWQIRNLLNITAMQEGANYLLGRHDFTTFRSTICQANSPIRTLNQLTIEEIPHPNAMEYRFHIRARSFLHNQVRSFVGTLERVGAGSWIPSDVKTALEAQSRSACGPVCPPQGLYLSAVKYPEKDK